MSWPQVDAIVEQFAKLAPYGGRLAGESLNKVEEENFDPDTGKQRENYCLAIASKRNGLAARAPDGRPSLIGDPRKRKRSEHGLGHLLSPDDPADEADDHRWFDRW
jgi:hypothetical protein